jgi:hypothetical protein
VFGNQVYKAGRTLGDFKLAANTRPRQPVTADGAKLERRAPAATEAALAACGFAIPIDVLVGIGWLDPAQLKQWRRARIGYLDGAVTVNLRAEHPRCGCCTTGQPTTPDSNSTPASSSSATADTSPCSTGSSAASPKRSAATPRAQS